MKAINIAMIVVALCVAPCTGAAQAVAGAAENFKRAQSLFWGDKDRGNDAEGVALVIRAGEAGYAEAQDYLALMYDEGLFVQVDPQASVLWAHKAVAQKYPDSMVRMAFKYLHANGVARDPAKARALLEEAAALGDARAWRIWARCTAWGMMCRRIMRFRHAGIAKRPILATSTVNGGWRRCICAVMVSRRVMWNAISGQAKSTRKCTRKRLP